MDIEKAREAARRRADENWEILARRQALLRRARAEEGASLGAADPSLDADDGLPLLARARARVIASLERHERIDRRFAELVAAEVAAPSPRPPAAPWASHHDMTVVDIDFRPSN